MSALVVVAGDRHGIPALAAARVARQFGDRLRDGWGGQVDRARVRRGGRTATTAAEAVRARRRECEARSWGRRAAVSWPPSSRRSRSRPASRPAPRPRRCSVSRCHTPADGTGLAAVERGYGTSGLQHSQAVTPPETTDSPDDSSPQTFADLQIHPAVLQAVSDVGYETPSAIQAATIPALLAGSDVVGLAQTGTGKTAAFAIPILSQDRHHQQGHPGAGAGARPVSWRCRWPRRSAATARTCRRSTCCRSTAAQSYTVQLAGLKRGAQVVVGTPGPGHRPPGAGHAWTCRTWTTWCSTRPTRCCRWASPRTSSASCADTPEYKQVALFSATMPPAIRKITTKYLHDAVEVTVKSKTATAENITQRYIQVAGPRKMDALTRVLEVEPFEAMIVFVRTKQATEEVAEKLRARGFAASAINGDIPQALARAHHRRAQETASIDILVATDVAARGLDVERISHVLNYDIPHDPESYVHRIGRTGRAGRSGTALLFVSPRERHLLKSIEKVTRQPVTEDAAAQRRGRQRPAGGQVPGLDHRGAQRPGLRHVPPPDRGLRTRQRRADGRHRRGAGAAVARRRGVPDDRAAAGEAPRSGPSATSGNAPRARPATTWRPIASRSARGTRWVPARSSARSPTKAGCTAATSATSPSRTTSRWSSCPPSCRRRR